jgi:hypothetical protein
MAAQNNQPENLEQVLHAASGAGDGFKSASVDDLLNSVGHRSFGPFLLMLALVAFTPLGGIPGLPTVLAAMVILTQCSSFSEARPTIRRTRTGSGSVISPTVPSKKTRKA